ncbi:MAG: ferredoxin [Acidimicrobiales bacterium]
MRVHVQEDVCQGHTQCFMVAPEVFELREEDGHAFVKITEFTPELIEAANRAALNCPEQAIIVEP